MADWGEVDWDGVDWDGVDWDGVDWDGVVDWGRQATCRRVAGRVPGSGCRGSKGGGAELRMAVAGTCEGLWARD